MENHRRISGIILILCAILTLLLALFLLLSAKNESGPVSGGRQMPLKCSSLLSISDYDGYSVVSLRNPWGGGELARYILVPRAEELPDRLPEGTLLRTPLSRVVLFSGTHAALLEEFDAVDAIAGVCDSRYIYAETVAGRISEGLVADCGSSMDIDAERLLEVSPDAVLVLPFENGGYGKLDRLNIPLVECAEYMENSPLASAEWIRFYGRLFGKAEFADSVFNEVSSEYEKFRDLAAASTVRPKLLCELKSSSAWYVPGGESTMGRMYADAGADYLFSYCKGCGSVPLSFETVLERAADADIWLMKYNSPVEKSYSSLLDEYSGYALLRPFAERNIFSCNTACKRLFEESAFHPERLLKELVAIFHPELMPGYKMRYYERMRQ